ncbi:MAG: SAF domain-containing protein [Clostridiales bacterium]|jgi:Flp pilus assembly protein CpaB|nr:SAF domain-containing protein [Eubacteriales bacterium]MDH7566140.1 SAF domain-containing protein [Clostridiales bacterium]
MKRINLILVTLALAAAFLGVEIAVVKSAAKYEPEISVVFAKKRIAAQTEISADMLYEKKINVSLAHRLSVKSIKDLEGKKAKTDIEEGEMVLNSRIGGADEMEEIKLEDKNNRLFTVEFKGDQVNGWWLATGQRVDILFVPDEKVKPLSPVQAASKGPAQESGQEGIGAAAYAQPPFCDVAPLREGGLQRLNNIRIAALIDEKGSLLKNTGRETLPKYISFEVTDKQDEFLAYAKSNGRLEVSALPWK